MGTAATSGNLAGLITLEVDAPRPHRRVRPTATCWEEPGNIIGSPRSLITALARLTGLDRDPAGHSWL
jgi:hypothetical protein